MRKAWSFFATFLEALGPKQILFQASRLRLGSRLRISFRLWKHLQGLAERARRIQRRKLRALAGIFRQLLEVIRPCPEWSLWRVLAWQAATISARCFWPAVEKAILLCRRRFRYSGSGYLAAECL